MLRKAARDFIKNIKTSFLERLLSLSIYKERYNELLNLKVLSSREDLWDYSISLYDGKEITLLEFGVREGYSLNYFSKLNKNKNSSFYGFDSFEGLPTDWSDIWPKGSFSVNGAVPQTEDKRINFVKGWFQDSLPKFLENFKPEKNLVVHYDADLYNSTLFCLTQLDALKITYIAIFDEFYSHEMRALANYQDAYGAKVEFIGKTNSPKPLSEYPKQVTCKIIPSKNYIV